MTEAQHGRGGIPPTNLFAAVLTCSPAQPVGREPKSIGARNHLAGKAVNGLLKRVADGFYFVPEAHESESPDADGPEAGSR